jgi:hypothetical protein
MSKSYNISMISYDILDNIINYLDVDSIINLIVSSKELYSIYRHNKHYEIVMINKMIKYFSSLKRFEINYRKMNDDDINELYICLNKIYNNFNRHKNASLSEMLVYLCDNNMSHKNIFEKIISYCYFTKNGEYVYNAIRADDLLYLLTFCKGILLITKYIYIDAVILLNVIKYKISTKNKEDTLFLFNYLLFKHFFRYSEYIEDIITDIVCEIIKYDDILILDEIYKKQNMYKFKLNYQKIINSCIRQKRLECLELAHVKMSEQNQLLSGSNIPIQPLMITKDYVRIIMKKKAYFMLSRVIELYLSNIINMNGYVNEIINNFDYNNNECLELLRYFNDNNKNRINERMKEIKNKFVLVKK